MALGFRLARCRIVWRRLCPQRAYALHQNTAGDANFAAAGLSWKLGTKLSLRPGIGLAILDGPGRGKASPDRIDFESRILFEPELAVGVQTRRRTTAELSWVHLSHAKLFGCYNPGMDSFGLRLNYRY